MDWELLKDGRIIFIDSAMGTGKTTAIKNYIKYFKNKINEDHKKWQMQDKKYDDYIHQQNQKQKKKSNEFEKYFDNVESKPIKVVDKPIKEPKT